MGSHALEIIRYLFGEENQKGGGGDQGRGRLQGYQLALGQRSWVLWMRFISVVIVLLV